MVTIVNVQNNFGKSGQSGASLRTSRNSFAGSASAPSSLSSVSCDTDHSSNKHRDQASRSLTLTISTSGKGSSRRSENYNNNSAPSNMLQSAQPQTSTRPACSKNSSGRKNSSYPDLAAAFQLGNQLGEMTSKRSSKNLVSSLLDMLGAGNSGYGSGDYSPSSYGLSNYAYPFMNNLAFNGFNDANSYNMFNSGFGFNSGLNDDSYSFNNSNTGGYGSDLFGLGFGGSNSLASFLPLTLAAILEGGRSNSNDYASDKNCNEGNNFDNSNAITLTLSAGKNAPVTPAGFTKSTDGKIASLDFGNNTIAFNQANQGLAVTNKTTGKSVPILEVNGDPHETTIDPKTGVKVTKDFNGNKNYKLPDGTQMTLVTGKPAGSNALTTTYSAMFSKKGEESVEVNNISSQKDGGLTATYTDRHVARATEDSAVSMSTINDKGEIVV